MTDTWTQRAKAGGEGNTTWILPSRATLLTAYPTWTVATRPVPIIDAVIGKNTDFDGIEMYNIATGKWHILNGTWTTSTRPDTTNIAQGSMGFNTDTGYGTEMFNGAEWQLL